MKKLLLLLLLPILSFSQNCVPTTIIINLDQYQSETSWDVKDSTGLVVAGGSGYGSQPQYGIVTEQRCLPVGPLVFTIYDSYGDGVNGALWGGLDGSYYVMQCYDTLIYGTVPNFFYDTAHVLLSAPCPPIFGCMDSSYVEFNPRADTSDGSCNTLIVFGCIDSTMYNYDSLANTMSLVPACEFTLTLTDLIGDGWAPTSNLEVIQGDSVWNFTLDTVAYSKDFKINLKSPQPVSFKFSISNQGMQSAAHCGFKLTNPLGITMIEVAPPFIQPLFKRVVPTYCGNYCVDRIFGCMDPLALNYVDTANTNTQCFYVLGCTSSAYLEYYTQGFVADTSDNSCLTPAVWGCNDATAFNYNSLANIDNGGCISVILGCMQPLAFNYNAQANTADTCIAIVYGCMSSIAINYNSLANTDDGSCVGIIYGCTDTSMWNYAPSANVDDGGCVPYIYGCTDVTMWNYNQQANTDNGSCLEYVYGCTNSVMWNYNPLANTDNENCIPYIYGCTNPIAINYNAQANTDDFSCIIPVYGCMDSIAFNYDPLANTDNGTCVPVVLGCTNPTALNYDAFANVDDFSCVLPIYGCLDSLAFNYDALANVDNGSCLPVVLGCIDPIALNYCDSCNTDDFSCVLPIYGCTDSIMFNYNPLANVDNSSCIPYVFGCTDPSMLNYDPLSNTEDFTCIEFIYGCMDEEALNYDSLANTENESCITIVEGCMDLNAYNYSDEANVSDSNCLYDASCITGPGLPYWLNDPCYAWVISVDDYCCDNEWDEVCQLTYNYCDGTYIGDIPARKAATKKIVAITDLLGRPVKEGNNKLLFYIYDDGTVEKKINKNN